MCDYNANPFITTLNNIILAPDLCDELLSILTLMNSVCLFQKVCCTVYFGEKEKKCSYITTYCTKEYAFLGETKEMSNTKKLASRKKIALKILYQI